MAKVVQEAMPWTVPNFVVIKTPARPRQEGWVEPAKLALSEVEPETLAAMCDDFRREVFRKAGKRDPVAPR